MMNAPNRFADALRRVLPTRVFSYSNFVAGSARRPCAVEVQQHSLLKQCGQSIIVVAFSLPVGSFRSSGSISSSHTPSKGSGRVRHRCSGFVCDGNEPLCHLRAERTLIPALAAAVCCVLPSIRFRLSSLTCRSVINGTSVPNDYPISTGKNGRRYRQDQLSLISTSGKAFAPMPKSHG